MSTHLQKLAALQQTEFAAVRHEPPAEARASASQTLSRLLVEVLDVALCARHAHWNARGPDYLPFYDLLEEIGGDLDRQAGRIAMRIGALAGTVHCTAHHIVTESSIKLYPLEVTEDQDHMDAIALRLGLLSAEARLSLHDCNRLGDPVTVQIIVEAIAAIDHALRRVESHLLTAS